ncbi:hypothetical protein M9H77_06540 [Catharanthus roseus]|uniref:Uncharacterized protein n=1 Tax=Catharanthus roseus TaxID=4058 RepID=A0ACC0BSD1_CATRO|nr:hypothetical protein M9H77_06540 [Catharanthus roseus]
MLKKEETAEEEEKEKGCHLENEEGQLVRGGQDESDEEDEEDDDDEEQKRQERMEEGQSSVDMAQLTTRIITMQLQLNSRLDDIDRKLHNRLDDNDDKIVDIQNRNKRNIFGVLTLHYIEVKDLCDQGIMKKKRSSHSKIKA